MTVSESKQATGIMTLIQQREAAWSQWEEKINESSDAIAQAIRDRVLGIIGNYFEKQCSSPVIALPTKNNPHSISVDCSFKSPMTSIFWQCIDPGSDSEPSVLTTIRNDIPEKPIVKKEKLQLDDDLILKESQPHEIKPRVDYNRLDTLLTGIAKKACEQIQEALSLYANDEGNEVFKFDTRIQTGCSSSSSFSKSSFGNSMQAVVTNFWVEGAKKASADDDDNVRSSYLPSGSLFSFLGSKNK